MFCCRYVSDPVPEPSEPAGSKGSSFYERHLVTPTQSSLNLIMPLDFQTKELWRDSKEEGWEDKTEYSWKLIHRPTIGLIRFVDSQT